MSRTLRTGLTLVLALTQLSWVAPASRSPAAFWRPPSRPPAGLSLDPMASLVLPMVGARLPWVAREEKSCGNPALRPQEDQNPALRRALAPAQDGLEETARVAGVIRQYRLAPDLTAETSDAAVVEAFVNRLRQPPNRTAAVLPPLSVATYRPGPFSREALRRAGRATEEHYLHEEWLPAFQKAIGAVAEQVGVTSDALGRLGLPALEQFLTDLYWAQDAEGRLLMGPDEENIFYRWAYREIPQWLVPALADPAIDREVLRHALANPFRRTNDEGNDVMVTAIAKLFQRPLSEQHPNEFVDAPGPLQARPALLMSWIRLLLASNLVDYSRGTILQEIAQEGDLAQYVVNRIHTPFLDVLGGDRYVQQFLARILQRDTKLIQFPDNNAQLAASLKVAEVLLSANPTLTIAMVLKGDNGAMNDASVEDAERLLAPGYTTIYDQLRAYRQPVDGHPPRFRILRGPATHGSPLTLLPAEVVAALQEADVVFAEGEANAWTFNGLAKELYLGLRLKWPDGVRRVFGVNPEALSDAEQLRLRPPAFVRLDGRRGPYYENIFSFDGRSTRTIAQTLREQAAGAEEPTASIGPAAGYMATSLFEYPAQLQWLVEQFQSNGVPRVIVSAGSSSGEEPASIAYTVRTELGERFSVYAIEPDDERLADMRHHFVDGAPFAMAPGIAHPPEALARVSDLNHTIAQWSSQIEVVDTPMESAPPVLYQNTHAMFLNRVADVPSIDTDAVAVTLLQLPPNAVLYTTRKDEGLLDLAQPGSGFFELRQDPNSEAVAWRRMSRAEELTDLSGVLYDKDVLLGKNLREGTVVVLSHEDARWIPRGRQLLLVPRVSEAQAPTVTLWVEAALRDSVVGRVPPTVTVKSFEPEADLPTAIRAVSTFPEEGAVQLVAVSAGQRGVVASITGSHVPIIVLDPSALPEEFSSLLADLAARASQLDGRLIDVTRGPVEQVTIADRAVYLLYSV